MAITDMYGDAFVIQDVPGDSEPMQRAWMYNNLYISSYIYYARGGCLETN